MATHKQYSFITEVAIPGAGKTSTIVGLTEPNAQHYSDTRRVNFLEIIMNETN